MDKRYVTGMETDIIKDGAFHLTSKSDILFVYIGVAVSMYTESIIIKGSLPGKSD